MAHVIRNGKAGGVRILSSALLFLVFSFNGFGQTCITAAAAASVHAEGLTEEIGNITLTCAGGTAGSQVSASLIVSLNANITNRLSLSGTLENISVTAGGFPTGAAATLYSPVALSLTQVNYTVPSPSSTPVSIIISGVRAAIPSIGAGNGTIVSGSILGIQGVQVPNGQLQGVALGYNSLLDSVINNGIPCSAGSPAPVTSDFPGLLAAQTASSTVRITEGYPNAFPPNIPPDPTADTGVRILVNLAGYGSNTQVYVPDAIVGNDGTNPTSAGAFGSTFSAGSYSPGQLLLLRVQGADATGTGGTFVLAPPGGAATFATVSQLNLTNGSGYAVYEVVDGNPNNREFAQIPVFVSVPANSCSTSSQAPMLGPELAPVSNVSVATPADPIPRFVASTPGSDCQSLGDCSAFYFPTLQVDTTPITLSGNSLGPAVPSGVAVNNSGSGQVSFTVSVTYPAGQTQASWLSVTPASGNTNAALSILANPGALPQGQYLATITVNAGSAGSASIPLTFNVGAPGVTITSVVNAASQQAGALAPDSFATVYGANLNGTNVQAVFNGYQATVVYDSATQINLLVPAALGTAQSAGFYVVVNGSTSNTFDVSLTPNAPAIFTPGILNQNNSVNSTAQPASVGDFVQIFLTGLATPVAGPVTVNIGNQSNLPAVYAGAVASINGLEQVNVQIPTALQFTGNSTNLSICIPGTGSQPICTNTVSLYMH